MYSLPDDQKIRLGEELMRIPEQMFAPVPEGFCKRSVQDMVASSIGKCDESLQEEFYHNILITGGNSLMSGYTQRLGHELENLNNGNFELDVRKERVYQTWIGASLLASLSTFQDMCIKRDDYISDGVYEVKKKCLL